MEYKINKKLILESVTNKDSEIVELTLSNFDEYIEGFLNVYKKQFLNFTAAAAKHTISKDTIMLGLSNKKVVSFIRYGSRSDNKYTKFFKIQKILMLSDLASIKIGYGKKLLNYMIKNSKNIDIVTIPWNDSLIKYYENFGFKTYSPKSKNMPGKLMIRRFK